MASTADVLPATQHLTLQVAGEQYAIPLLAVREIIQYESATRVPHTPPWIHGVINLRGLVVAVVDLAVKFGLPPTAPARETCIVMVDVTRDGAPVVLGLLADAVHQVIDLSPGDIQPPPEFGTPVRIEFLRGVGVVDKALVLLLEIGRLLLPEEALAAEAAREEMTRGA